MEGKTQYNNTVNNTAFRDIQCGLHSMFFGNIFGALLT